MEKEWSHKRFAEYFLQEGALSVKELAKLEPSRSASLYYAYRKGDTEPPTPEKFEIMSKTKGFVMPWHWLNFKAIPKEFLAEDSAILLQYFCKVVNGK